MSEQLEFELIYLLDLVDEELISVLEKMNAWDDLQVCAAIFDLDITAVTDPSDIFDELILQKADQHLPEAKANAFKRIWEKVNADLRIPLAVKILLAD